MSIQEAMIVAENGVRPSAELLRFDATVPRHLVHRAAVAEVFVTDSAVVDENLFVVAAQLPRGHYFGEDPAVYDFALLVEMLRQAGVLVAHRYYDVSREHPFIFRSLGLSFQDLGSTRIKSSPANVVIYVNVVPERNRAGRLRGFAFQGGARIDGQPALDGEGKLLFLTTAGYQALRSRGRHAKLECAQPVSGRFAPAHPRVVGRRDPRNVVITEPMMLGNGRIGASLVVDVNHPHMFDHPLDHVPGNLELEACRQLSVAAVAQRHGLAADSLAVANVTVDFGEFAELDLLTRVTAEVGEIGFDERLRTSVTPLTVEMTQAGAIVASAKMRVAGWS